MQRFKRGMTIKDRQEIRNQVLMRELVKARIRAGEYRVSDKCVIAMEIMSTAPEMAREYHAKCTGEKPGAPGCLCLCHDTRTGGVTTRVVSVSTGDGSAIGGRLAHVMG